MAGAEDESHPDLPEISPEQELEFLHNEALGELLTRAMQEENWTSELVKAYMIISYFNGAHDLLYRTEIYERFDNFRKRHPELFRLEEPK